MKSQNFHITAASFLPITAIALASGIFIADTITELEIALPAFYTAVVLISVRFCKKRGVIFVGIACIALTLVSDMLTMDTAPSEAGIINTAIGLLAIAATTYLAVKIEMEREATYEAQSQLAHVVRLTTLGEMTTSIAHQINQPLAAVAINSSACLHWLDDDPPNLDEAKRSARNILRDANRASEIIAQVRNLTKGSPPDKVWLGINEIILSTVGLLDREIQLNQISLQTGLSNDVPPIHGDKIQLQQVILNLVLNAIEAMNGAPVEQRRLFVGSEKLDAKSVRISVQDSGAGWASENPERLFNAFYTTKHDGMGMGLAISRSIVETHGGRIWAAPNSPRGAVFQFILPTGANMNA